jgi:DNA-binding LytR/AlgR family response regulator
VIFRTLIVDDEPIARKVLREELELVPVVEIVGEADGGLPALELIEAYQPDLVLLDLQMPGMGGLEVMQSLKSRRSTPAIVIVTAHDGFALQAFEAGAVDYLLKPVGQTRLAEAVRRATRFVNGDAVETSACLQQKVALSGPASGTTRILGRIAEEYFPLSLGEIFAFQADGDLVWIITAQRKYRATQTLSVLERRLKESTFRRIHRNAMVNVDHIRKMSALSSQRWLITLENDQEFVASQRQARGIRELLRLRRW